MTTDQLPPTVRNGVDTAAFFATLDAVKAAPDAAQFQFRARNEWLTGTHSRSTIDDYFGGWTKAQKEHFDDGAIYDQILAAGRKK